MTTRSFTIPGHDVAVDLPALPKVATVLVTLACNSRCRYCVFGRSDNHAAVPGESDVLRVIDEIRAAGIREVCFSGGEPLTWAPLPRVISRAAELGMAATILTNGTLLKEQKLRALIDAGARLIIVSMDSFDPEVYESQRGVPLAGVVEALDLLARARETVPGFNFLVTSVLTPDSLPDAVGLAQELSRRDVLVQFQPVHGEGCSGRIDPALAGEIERLVDLVVPHGTVVNHPEYLRHIPAFFATGRAPADLPCLAGYLYLLVDTDLDVRICNRMAPLGNLRERSLGELIASEHAATTRERMLRQDCAGCWLLCTGQPVLELVSPYRKTLAESKESRA